MTSWVVLRHPGDRHLGSSFELLKWRRNRNLAAILFTVCKL